MRPDAVIVSGPATAVFLASGICSPGKYKRTFSTIIFRKSLICGFCHKMSVNIVNLFMCSILKLHIIRQWSVEACRLIHIIPYATDTVLEKYLCLLSPPASDALLCEVRKYRCSRPDSIFIYTAICIMCKCIHLHALFVHEIVLILFHTRVNDGYELYTPVSKLL